MENRASSPDWLGLRAKIFAAPWREWAHAYGPADDVPPLLEALATGSGEEREQACYQLYGNVFHQGTRWHASPRAVPFLLEMLALSSPSLPDRPWLIGYLVSLALGYEEEFLPRGIEPGTYFAEADALDDEQEQEELYDEEHLSGSEFTRFNAFARDSYHAVERGCDLFLALLSDGEVAVRLPAAYALAWFPSRSDDTSRALLQRWDDMGEPEQANALLVVAILGRHLPHAEQMRWAARADATLDLGGVAAKFAAAVAMANWAEDSGSQTWDSRAVQVLAGAVVGSDLGAWQDEQAAKHESLSWCDGDLYPLAAIRLASAPQSARSAAIEELLQAMPGAAPTASLTLTGSLLTLALPVGEDGSRPDIAPGNLSEEQKRVLASVAEHGAWSVSGGFLSHYSSLVRTFGLPSSQEELRAWLL